MRKTLIQGPCFNIKIVLPGIGILHSNDKSKTVVGLLSLYIWILILQEAYFILYSWSSIPKQLQDKLQAGIFQGCQQVGEKKLPDFSLTAGNPVFTVNIYRWLSARLQYLHCQHIGDTVETLYNTVNFCWSTHKRHSIAHPKGRGMECLLWVQRATYCVDLSKLSSIEYLL